MSDQRASDLAVAISEVFFAHATAGTFKAEMQLVIAGKIEFKNSPLLIAQKIVNVARNGEQRLSGSALRERIATLIQKQAQELGSEPEIFAKIEKAHSVVATENLSKLLA